MSRIYNLVYWFITWYMNKKDKIVKNGKIKYSI